VGRLARTLVGIAIAASAVALGGATPASQPPALDVQVLRFVDHSRTVRLPSGRRVARPVTTIVRAPTSGGPYPLIVFGHGYAGSPATYSALLDAWTAAGYVVAAPIFPLGNAEAPGGPDEDDLPNQPADMSLVITRLIALDAQPASPLYARIDPQRIAVAGHSDGAITALAVAYDARYRDRRVDAAIILSGAQMTGMGAFPSDGPPLLAVQGTGDRVNDARYTKAYYRRAHAPKFLVLLLGASHLAPYTREQPQLGIVERTTIAFLDHCFRDAPLQALVASARSAGVSTLSADP
jgi:pimeloyl-ACP methyl ester carboxylesterase